MSDTITSQELVSIQEAQARVGVSRRTIYNWIAAGKLEFVRTAGGSVRIVTSSLWRSAKGVRHGSNANDGGRSTGSEPAGERAPGQPTAR